jgi:alkylhydroperoxidase family enzyme
VSGDAVRALVPDVQRSYAETRATVLESGLVDRAVKRLCARALAGEDVEAATPREHAALGWVDAIAWDDRLADDALWAELHAHFSEPELVELGYFIAFTLGQTHWLRTLRP